MRAHFNGCIEAGLTLSMAKRPLISLACDCEQQTPKLCMQVVDARVPLAETFQYDGNLRDMTEGRAQYTMQLDRFDFVPPHIQDEIASKAGGVAV